MGRRADEFETVRYRSQKGSGLPRKVRRVIVEDHANTGPRRVVRVRQAQKFDELGTAMALAHQTQHLPAPQVKARQQRQRAVADELMITTQRRMLTGYRRQVPSSVLQGLNPRLVIVSQH